MDGFGSRIEVKILKFKKIALNMNKNILHFFRIMTSLIFWEREDLRVFTKQDVAKQIFSLQSKW